MASSWKDLHDDFMFEVLLYVEKLTITEEQVMRLLTKGMSEFQRRTLYVEATKQLTSPYDLGDDVLVVREIKDASGIPFMIVSDDHWESIVERRPQDSEGWYGYNEEPHHHGLKRVVPDRDDWGYGSRIARIWDNQIQVWPADATNDATFDVRYIQSLHAISSNSSQWTAWYPLDTNFFGQFSTTGPPDELSQFEDSFVQYAAYRYLESLGNQSYTIYEQRFARNVEYAVRNKPEYFHHGTAPYNQSPFSS